MGLPDFAHAEPDCRWPTHATSKPYLWGALLFDADLMSSVILWGGADISVKNESGYLPRFCGVYDAPGRQDGLTADVSQTT